MADLVLATAPAVAAEEDILAAVAAALKAMAAMVGAAPDTFLPLCLQLQIPRVATAQAAVALVQLEVP
jgi:hypothetical protein